VPTFGHTLAARMAGERGGQGWSECSWDDVGTSEPSSSRRRPLRRSLLIGAGVLAALVVAAGVWWFAGRDPRGTAADPVTAGPTAAALSAERATEISAQLSSGDESRLRQALLVPPDQVLDPGLVPGLQGLQFEFDLSTFEATGPDTGTVRARVTEADGASGTWVLYLFHSDGGWQIVSTAPQDES
jgi:hypothetical protein